MTSDYYEKCQNMPLSELAQVRTNYVGAAATAQLVYEEKMMKQQHEYNKQQLELQHKLNLELTNKQLRWIKFSAVLNATAIIAGALLGWSLSELKSSKKPELNPSQSIQYQTLPSTSVLGSGKKGGKVPSQSPSVKKNP